MKQAHTVFKVFVFAGQDLSVQHARRAMRDSFLFLGSTWPAQRKRFAVSDSR
jgi:hypothetical protein